MLRLTEAKKPLFSSPLRFSKRASIGTVRVLVDAEGHSSFARDGDALLLQATGWHLPVVGLRYWVRGLPAPGIESIPVYDEAGHLSRLEQSGWVINYYKYQLVEGAPMPSKMQLARDDVSVRLVIKQWQLGPSVATLP